MHVDRRVFDRSHRLWDLVEEFSQLCCQSMEDETRLSGLHLLACLITSAARAASAVIAIWITVSICGPCGQASRDACLILKQPRYLLP